MRANGAARPKSGRRGRDEAVVIGEQSRNLGRSKFCFPARIFPRRASFATNSPRARAPHEHSRHILSWEGRPPCRPTSLLVLGETEREELCSESAGLTSERRRIILHLQ